MKHFISVFLIAVAILAAHFFGLWVQLGGHPMWSQTVTLMGLAAGLGVVVLTGTKPSWGVVVLLAILTGLALQTSLFGKEEFVGSYAENRFARRIWFFGFIGFVAGLFASLTALIAKLSLGFKAQS